MMKKNNMMIHLRLLKFVLLMAVSLVILRVTEVHSWSTQTCESMYRKRGNSQIKLEQRQRRQKPLFSNSMHNQLDTNILSQNQCKFCSKCFDSRNALFRHLRTDPTCAELANKGKESPQFSQTTRQAIAFKFSYFTSSHPAEHQTGSKVCEAEVAGILLREAVENALNDFLQAKLNLNMTVDITSSAQTSICKLRHRSLAQETGCAAEGDVLTINFLAPASTHCISSTGFESHEKTKEFLDYIFQKADSALNRISDVGKNVPIQVHLVSCKWLADARFNAERSCTQRVYHYLLPLHWFPDGEQLEQWWLDDEIDSSDVEAMGDHKNRARSRPPSNSLRIVKNALRRAECLKLPPEILSKESPYKDREIKIASGRFGALATKERRPWHNFADPSLKGDASPNQEPVWRVLDRARIVKFLRIHTNVPGEEEEVVALIEFKGDDFVNEQVRRVVGTALAVAHGWLPSDFFDVATQSDTFLETPLAPPGRLYLDSVRFHFEELRTGMEFFAGSDVERNKGLDGGWVQKQLLEERSTSDAKEEEHQWLCELRDTVAPRIRRELNRGTMLGKVAEAKLKPVPDVYSNTLALLRSIARSGNWPDTSTARSNVIRKLKNKSESKGKCGSFTVVNPNFQDGLYKNGIGSDPAPLGNSLFPRLVEAVFDLEEKLSNLTLKQANGNGEASTRLPSSGARPISSHCAINCNAQFTPHVDSGRGAGQSLSMIVGLGDYVGGELGVEGIFHGIRYCPMEFDGWKLRHWTSAYEGERFSLVWFTPDSL